MTTNTNQSSLLEEIFMTASNEIIKDRFSKPSENEAADCMKCSGKCAGPGGCRSFE